MQDLGDSNPGRLDQRQIVTASSPLRLRDRETPAPQNLPPPGGYEPTLTPVNGEPGVFINEYGERVDQNGMPVDL